MNNEIESNAKRAVIYCRVSTKEQVDEGNSLASQERLCREYAAKQGYEVAEVFIEKGESAKTANRKELQKLLSFCADKRNCVDALIAYKVDRISRNIADYSYIKVKLKKNKILIKSATEMFEDTPAGRFMENIIANVSQFDNEVRSERSVGGMREAMTEEGRYVWRAPLGYDNAKVEGKATIVPNRLAPLITEAFRLIGEGLYSTEVVRIMMYQKGLTDKQGKAVCKSYFFRLIRNPTYKGVIRKFGLTAKGTYEPLVSEDLFDAVQAILKGRTRKMRQYVKEHPDFPLRNFVFNSGGKPLRGFWAKGRSKKYPYYSFHSPGTIVKKHELEEKFAVFLERFKFETRHLAILKHQLKQRFVKHYEAERLSATAVEKQIDETNQRIDTLIEVKGQGGISETVFLTRITKYETELRELQKLLRPAQDIPVDISRLLAFAATALQQLHILWKTSPVDIQRKLQWFIFPNGVSFDGANLQTAKLCSIFNLKVALEGMKFPNVPSEGLEINTLSGTIFSGNENLLENEVVWKQMVNELITLKNLIREKDI